MIRKLAHVCFHTEQVAAMLDFYQRVLGLPIKFTLKNAAGEDFGYYIAVGDTSFIEIFDRVLARKQWGGQEEPLTAGNRYAHFCLEVTDLAELRQTIIGRGGQVTEIKRGMDGSLQAWVTDPDGNRIELMQYTHQSRQLQ